MLKLIIFTMAIILIFIYVYTILAAAALPEQNSMNWRNCGVPGGIPGYPVSVNVLDYGAKPDIKSDSYKAFMAAIEAAKPNTAILIPAGEYLIKTPISLGKPIVLRGEGAGKTKIVFDFDGSPPKDSILILNGNYGNWQKISAGNEKGSTVVTVPDGWQFKAGDFAEICQDNDTEIMYTKPEWNQPWAQNVVGQVCEVVSVDSTGVTLFEPLHITYKTGCNARIRPASILKGAGVEDLSLKRLDNGDANMVYIKHAAYCWVRGVESEYIMRTHFASEYSYRCEFRDNIAHHAYDYGGGGHGYGVELKNRASNCLVENNNFYTLRHAMMAHLGANGNVFGYNTSKAPIATGDHAPDIMVCDVSIHGHYAFMNLFEGNTVQKIEISDYWGPTGPGNTFLNNRIEGEGIIINENSPGQNFLGNTVANKNFGLGISETVKPGEILQRGNWFSGKRQAGAAPKTLYRTGWKTGK
ncbi:MAG: glycoside hydrolase family 55 protein [Spirochaetia bacterium]|nr:glycoside hydrolase family 55 protein [Spirochaetia bacterium]